MNIRMQQGAAAASTMGALTQIIRREVRGLPAFQVNDTCRWTLNALSGGYAFPLSKAGVLDTQPEDNTYKLVMEAVETFGQWLMLFANDTDSDNQINYQYTANGRRYISARVAKHG